MAPLLLLLSVSLSQTVTQPPTRTVAVIPANLTPVGQKLEDHVRTALRAAQVPLKAVASLNKDEPIRCETNRMCFALLGRGLGVQAVVRVEAAVLQNDVAVLVEAIESATGKLIHEESFLIPSANVEAEIAGRVAPLAQKVAAVLPTLQTLVLSDAKPTLQNPALDLAARSEPKGFPIWATGAGAVVFAGASAGLLSLGVSARNCLHERTPLGAPSVCVPQGQVAGVQRNADVGLITGTAAAAIAVGLTITAIVQYASSN